jgi:hypothetical protein
MSRADIIFTFKLGLITATLILLLWMLNSTLG